MNRPSEKLCETLGGWRDRDTEAGAASGFIWMLLPRHGRRPAAFLGRELLRADSSAAVKSGAQDEWSDIRIFELPDAGFVTAVRHLRLEDGLPRWQDAWLTEDATETVARLQLHDAGLGLGARDAQQQRVAWLSLLRAVFGLDTPA
jgi:hypothetical protein